MDRKSVYLTWPDNVFSYQCRGCAECCKGLGIGLDEHGGQVEGLLNIYPELTPFVRKRGAAWTAFNPRGRCWFLDEQGLCRVESDHGRDAKPASCRLFPFNRVFRIGAFTIIDYNSVICPLRALPANAPDEDVGQSGRISHTEILAEVESIADPAVVGTVLPVDQPAEEGKRFVTRERAIAEVCFSQAASATPDLAAVWRAQTKDGALDHARSRISRALRIVTGQSYGSPSQQTLRVALWLTPSMRFNELFGPRDYDPRPEREKTLADIWLTWLHFLAVAEKLSSRPMSLREATSTWSEIVPLAHLLARFDQAPIMEPGPVELPGEDDPDQVVRQFAEACIGNRKARKPAASLLSPLLEPYIPHDRVALARMIEPLYRSIRWRKPRKP